MPVTMTAVNCQERLGRFRLCLHVGSHWTVKEIQIFSCKCKENEKKL